MTQETGNGANSLRSDRPRFLSVSCAIFTAASKRGKSKATSKAAASLRFDSASLRIGIGDGGGIASLRFDSASLRIGIGDGGGIASLRFDSTSLRIGLGDGGAWSANAQIALPFFAMLR